MQKMPKEIEFVAEKILYNKQLYKEIHNMLKRHIVTLNNESMGHSSFCNALKTPKHLDKALLKIFGISDRQCNQAFIEIGFHPSHAMYSDIYYQTLLLVYYIGVRSDDDLLRIFCTTLIYVKLFNGRQYKFMPNGCQEEIAHYLIENVFRKSKVFAKHRSPFSAITQYFAPTIDTKYNDQIRKDPGHPSKGLIVILAQSWNRMEQTFMGIQKHYYKAYNDGMRQVVGEGTGGQGEEVDRLDGAKITSFVEKLQRNMVHREPELSDSDKKVLKSAPYAVKDSFILSVEDFLNDESSENDLKNIYEMLFTITNKHEGNICELNIYKTVNDITNAKGNNKDITKFKKYIDTMLDQMYKGIMKTGSTSLKLKLRKILIIIIVFRAVKAFCPKTKL